MKFTEALKTLLPERERGETFPVSISVGMHVSIRRVRPVYLIMLSLVALGGLYGSVLTFVTACENKGSIFFDKGRITRVIIISWLLFSTAYGISERFPKISRGLVVLGGGGTVIFCSAKFARIAIGVKYIANRFMSALFIRYSEKPLYDIPDFLLLDDERIYTADCGELALCCAAVLCAFVLCRFIKSPNLLLFICATFPLPELCLYFGMVPDYGVFIILAAAWCGAAAAEITRFGMFSGKEGERIFTKTSAQSAAAAAAVMAACFTGALIYVKATGFERPESVDNFRNNFTVYMRDFSWKKFSEDFSDALLPSKTKKLTHEGKLGNTSSTEFTGQNMLEVTLPSDAEGLYLKGFTGNHYTGSRWEETQPLPRLDTNITSPEFFAGRVLRHVPSFSDLYAKDVIVRGMGANAGTKYYPLNSAGLLETDGVRRRYGVYFPGGNWRSSVIYSADSIYLDEVMASDEMKMRSYAYNYCLEMPETFTAYEDFFKDFRGGTDVDALGYIRRELAKRCSYTLDAGKKPFASDFVQWFLTDNRKGSCTHFASAAVLLCRSLGIPARYCEGFIIRREDITSFPSVNGYTTVSVPDSRAHAWAEVYIDGYGWLNFEATPGYGNMILDTSGGYDSYERAEASEITTVTTAPPSFVEDPAANTTEEVTEVSAAEDGTETAVSREEDFLYDPAVTTAEQEEPVYGREDERPLGNGEERPRETGVADADGEEGTDENGGANGGVGGADDGNSPVGTGGGAPVPAGAEDKIDNTETSSPSPESELTAPPKEIPKALFGVLIFMCAAALTAALPFIHRKAVFSRRKRGYDTDPRRAAGQMYRLLIRAARADNVPEDVPAELEKLGVDSECSEIIVETAMKARFGGGIDPAEAGRAAEALTAALSLIFKQKNALGTAVSWLAATDRYF